MSQRIFTALHTGILVLLLGGLPAAMAAEAPDTTALTVMVRSDDAKFIGSGVGGLNVQVRNVDTGEVLAHGPLVGGTGDTEALMLTPQTRGRSATVGDAARFEADLPLTRPTRVEVSLSGPLGVAQSAQAASVTLWLLPGEDRAERPLVLHMPGLIANLVDYQAAAGEVAVTAQVTMLCGCPINREGLWPASDFTVMLQVYQQGAQVAQQALEFTGVDNEFAAAVALPGGGDFELEVTASQHSTGNAGVYRHPLRVDAAPQ